MTFETSTLKVEISPFLIRFVSFIPNLELTKGYNLEFVSLFYLYKFSVDNKFFLKYYALEFSNSYQFL